MIPRQGLGAFVVLLCKSKNQILDLFFYFSFSKSINCGVQGTQSGVSDL